MTTLHWYEIFTFGTLWFWILTTAAFIFILANIEKHDNDDYTGTSATVAFFIYLGLLMFLGNKESFYSALEWVTNNPLSIVGCIIGYLVAGVIWSKIKWYLFLSRYKMKVEAGEYSFEKKYVSFLQNKSKLITWMSYWPLSALWTSINDPIRRTFELITHKLQASYQNTSDKMFSEIKEKK